MFSIIDPFFGSHFSTSYQPSFFDDPFFNDSFFDHRPRYHQRRKRTIPSHNRLNFNPEELFFTAHQLNKLTQKLFDTIDSAEEEEEGENMKMIDSGSDSGSESEEETRNPKMIEQNQENENEQNQIVTTRNKHNSSTIIPIKRGERSTLEEIQRPFKWISRLTKEAAPEDVKIHVDKKTRTLTVEVKKESKKEENGTKSHSSFHCKQSTRIPEGIELDKLIATFNNGILSIESPNKKNELIPITDSSFDEPKRMIEKSSDSSQVMNDDEINQHLEENQNKEDEELKTVTIEDSTE